MNTHRSLFAPATRIISQAGFLVLVILSCGMLSAQTPSEPSGVAGKISREVWWNIGGVDLESLWNKEAFYQTADLQDQLDGGLESPVGIGSNFGQRLRGYVTAPVTGEYRFWLSGNDHAALWLSDGENKFSKRKLIHFRGTTGHRQWGKYRAQLSDVVQLEVGKRYYVEVQQKEGGGGDHVSVGWSYAGGNGLVNWAREAGALASQSSTGYGGVAARAIDGNTSGDYNTSTITHTLNQIGNWWQVDLGVDRQIDRVELFNWNKWGVAITSRLSNFRISVLDGAGNVVVSKDYHIWS